MAHPHRALRWELPHVECERHEVVGRDAALVGQALAPAFLGRARPAEAALARHHDPLGHVAQHRVGGRAERTPGTRARRPFALLPHDLTAGEHPQVVLQDGHDVRGQAAVGLAAEVGHVDGDAPTGLEHPLALVEHVAQQLEVLDIRTRDTLAVELLLVLLSGEVGRRGHDESHRVIGHGTHTAGVAGVTGHTGFVGGDVLVGTDLGGLEAGVEGVGDV